MRFGAISVDILKYRPVAAVEAGITTLCETDVGLRSCRESRLGADVLQRRIGATEKMAYPRRNGEQWIMAQS